MSDRKNTTTTELAVPERERPASSVNTKGIQMPAHEIRKAIAYAIATHRVKSEEDGELISWLYGYARENVLGYADLEAVMKDRLGDKLAPSANTVYQVFHGSYMAASWAGVLDPIRKFRAMVHEELKRKSIGFIETETAKIIFKACRSAMNDGMPAFIYGASQMGKTTALLEYQRLNNHGRTHYLRFGSRWTKSRVVRELAAMLGNGVKATKQWALEDAIFAGISKYNLLIVDEFHLALETTTEAASKEIVEFVREVYDRTGCGLVLASTKVGLGAFEGGRNKMLFDQLRRRGVVKVVLPDVPPVRDINVIARSFDLPLPTGETLADIKMLLKSRGLGVFIKYLQKAYALSKEDGSELTWSGFRAVCNGYAKLEGLKSEY